MLSLLQARQADAAASAADHGILLATILPHTAQLLCLLSHLRILPVSEGSKLTSNFPSAADYRIYSEDWMRSIAQAF